MRYLQQTGKEVKVKLDVKDKKILSLLASDARMPATAIAKHVGVSRDAVSYRTGRYSAEGVIQGYRTVVDIGRFGFDAYHIFLQLNQPNKEVEDKLIGLFKGYEFVRAVLKFNGKYDFELAIVAKNIKEFDGHLDKVLGDCAEHVQSYEVMIISDIYVTRTFPRSFFADENPKTEKIHVEGNTGKENKIEGAKGKGKADDREYILDEVDHKILHALSEDATLPYYEVSRKIKTSHDIVRYRMGKMKDSGVITAFVPVINYSAISYSVYGVLLRMSGLDREKNEMLRQLLHTDRNVLWAVKCVGSYNVLLYVCVRETEELHATLNGLRNHFPEKITDYQILIAYEEYKYTYFPDYVFI